MNSPTQLTDRGPTRRIVAVALMFGLLFAGQIVWVLVSPPGLASTFLWRYIVPAWGLVTVIALLSARAAFARNLGGGDRWLRDRTQNP